MRNVLKHALDSYRDDNHKRHEIVSNLSNLFALSYDSGQATFMQSSGTTGSPKTYHFGPHALEVGQFFFDTLTEDSGVERHVYITASDQVERTYSAPYGDFMPGVECVVIGRDILNNHEKIRRLLNTPSGNLGIHTTPWNAVGIFEKYNICLNDIADRVVFFNTCGDVSYVRKYIDKRHIVRNHMRCWDGGATFYTCKFGNMHWLDILFELHESEDLKLITTDILNKASIFDRYWNGDLVKTKRSKRCRCGMPIDEIEFCQPSEAIYCFNGVYLGYDRIEMTIRKYVLPIIIDDFKNNEFDFLCVVLDKQEIITNVILSLSQKKKAEAMIAEMLGVQFSLISATKKIAHDNKIRKMFNSYDGYISNFTIVSPAPDVFDCI